MYHVLHINGIATLRHVDNHISRIDPFNISLLILRRVDYHLFHRLISITILKSIRMPLFTSTPLPFPANLTFTGQTILVTGATSGLGLEAAIHYIKLGASTVFIIARTLSKGLIAKSTIVERTGCDTAVSEVLELDMDTFASVKTLDEMLKRQAQRLDIVLLNAGVFSISKESQSRWVGR